MHIDRSHQLVFAEWKFSMSSFAPAAALSLSRLSNDETDCVVYVRCEWLALFWCVVRHRPNRTDRMKKNFHKSRWRFLMLNERRVVGFARFSPRGRIRRREWKRMTSGESERARDGARAVEHVIDICFAFTSLVCVVRLRQLADCFRC